MLRILILLSLCFGHSVLAIDSIPLTGSWKIVSYQILGYPSMDETERDKWLGNIIQFGQQVKLNNGKQTCTKFSYKETIENSEAQFLTGYNVKPNQLGVIDKTVQLIEITCKTDSWLNTSNWFTKISDIHMLGYWDGVIFFFVKQTDDNLLLITPQSVGMINSKSLFEQKIITKSLPKYIFDENFKSYRKDELMLEIYPDSTGHKIGRINIFDDRAIAPANAKIGMSYKDIFKNPETTINCKAGVRKLTGKTICSFENLPTIQYVFKPKPKSPPIKALKDAKLIEFIWLAKSTLMEESELPDRSIPEVTDIKNTDDNHIDNFKIQTTRLNNIKNRVDMLLKNLTTEDFATAILDFNNAQQAWTQYSYKHCQWHSTFLGVAEDMFACMEKITRERADELEIFLQEP
ncbi:MAG: DUF1311 domain-containing protein [Candidatus Marithrix sp.]|nr:DUF1311 domain-containing protein [Candidatus Marithrix sp.]